MSGAPLSETVKTVTERPAKALGIFPKKGSLAAGSDADIVIMDSACNIIATFARGAKKL
jgi:N-acetylglucosamine-6-phosphate deacetylase